ncbi:MAG: hypothetical protein JW754_01360 [Candidatus Aenigmarchaeota archaeon]|nr:hypothetical protein [Candidatus Aenigmarchaeota archaeon]
MSSSKRVTARGRLKNLATEVAHEGGFGCTADNAGHIIRSIDNLDYNAIRRFRYREKKTEGLGLPTMAEAAGRRRLVHDVGVQKLDLLKELTGSYYDSDALLPLLESSRGKYDAKADRIYGGNVLEFGDRREAYGGILKKTGKAVATGLAACFAGMAFMPVLNTTTNLMAAEPPESSGDGPLLLAYHDVDYHDINPSDYGSVQQRQDDEILKSYSGSGKKWSEIWKDIRRIHGLDPVSAKSDKTNVELIDRLNENGRKVYGNDYDIRELITNDGRFTDDERVVIELDQNNRPIQLASRGISGIDIFSQTKPLDQRGNDFPRPDNYKRIPTGVTNVPKKMGLTADMIGNNVYALAATGYMTASTMSRLRKYGPFLTGEDHEPWEKHHLYPGIILHAIGAGMKEFAPETYRNMPRGFKFVTGIVAPVMTADDYCQHREQERRFLGKTGPVEGPSDYHSPIHNLGGFMNSKEMNDIPVKVGTDFLKLPGDIWMTMGHYKGPYVGFSKELLGSGGPVQLSLQNMNTLDYARNGPMTNMLEYVTIGPEIGIDLIPGYLRADVGGGLQVYFPDDSPLSKSQGKGTIWAGVTIFPGQK